jgi:hypothetical protein
MLPDTQFVCHYKGRGGTLEALSRRSAFNFEAASAMSFLQPYRCLDLPLAKKCVGLAFHTIYFEPTTKSSPRLTQSQLSLI